MTDTNRQSEIIIRREEERIRRNEAKAEAFEENMKKTLSKLLKESDTKKALAREAMEATRNPGRHDPFFEKAGAGTYRDDREIVTGNEPRPWEED